MMIPPVPVCYRITPASLTASQFQILTEVLPEIEPFANLTEPNTRQAYQQDIQGFMAFEGLRTPKHFHDATRAHVLVSRDHLVRQEPADDTIRRELAVQPSFYAYLCERHAVLYNPVQGVKRALDKPGSHHARAW